MRAPPLASNAAVAAPRPDAEPVTIAHKPSFDIRTSPSDFGLARCWRRSTISCGQTPANLQNSQICKTPLHGINAGQRFMPPLQGALRASALVMAVAFPHHAGQE